MTHTNKELVQGMVGGYLSGMKLHKDIRGTSPANLERICRECSSTNVMGATGFDNEGNQFLMRTCRSCKHSWELDIPTVQHLVKSWQERKVT